MRRDSPSSDDIVRGIVDCLDGPRRRTRRPRPGQPARTQSYKLGNHRSEDLLRMINLRAGHGARGEARHAADAAGDVKDNMPTSARSSADHGFAPTTSIDEGHPALRRMVHGLSKHPLRRLKSVRPSWRGCACGHRRAIVHRLKPAGHAQCKAEWFGSSRAQRPPQAQLDEWITRSPRRSPRTTRPPEAPSRASRSTRRPPLERPLRTPMSRRARNGRCRWSSPRSARGPKLTTPVTDGAGSRSTTSSTPYARKAVEKGATGDRGRRGAGGHAGKWSPFAWSRKSALVRRALALSGAHRDGGRCSRRRRWRRFGYRIAVHRHARGCASDDLQAGIVEGGAGDTSSIRRCSQGSPHICAARSSLRARP